MEVQTSDNDVTSIMYDKFFHLVHTSYSINIDHDAPSHVSESQSQSLENTFIEMQEDININH